MEKEERERVKCFYQEEMDHAPVDCVGEGKT